MPEMDGFQATKHIRDAERLMNVLPENRDRPQHIPIIAVTAHALAEMRDKCAQAGMDDFVTKPFDDLQLTEALRRHLKTADATPDTAPEPVEPIDALAIQQIQTIEARGSKGLLKRIVTKFIGVAPVMAADIRATCNARDSDALWRVAHGLKSSASAVGATQVSLCCGEIEQVARQTGAATAATLLDGLDAEIAAAIRSLQDLIADSDASVH
jgi:HPt (histidine-containing phosphotransfer) domain-containing protein